MKPVPHDVPRQTVVASTLSEALYKTIYDGPYGKGPLFDSPHDIAVHIRKAPGDHYKGVATDSLAGYIQQCAPIDGRPPQKRVSKRLAQSMRIAVVEKLGGLYSSAVLEVLTTWLPSSVEHVPQAVTDEVATVPVSSLLERWSELENITIYAEEVSALVDSGFLGRLIYKLLWRDGQRPTLRFILPDQDSCQDLWGELERGLLTRVRQRYAIPLADPEGSVRAFVIDLDEQGALRVLRYDGFVRDQEPFILADLRTGFRCVAGIHSHVQWSILETQLGQEQDLFVCHPPDQPRSSH